MNKKTQGLRVKRSKEIPLYIDGLTSSSAVMFYISGSTSIIFTPRFITSISGIFQQYINMEIDNDTISASPTYYVVGAAPVPDDSGDCTGKYSSIFDSTGNVLYVGRDSTSLWKSWIPFTINFGVDAGVHIVSARLNLIPADTKYRIEGKPCKIKIACENKRNPSNPTSYSTLNSRAMTKNFFSGSDIDTWTEGEEQSFDVTSSVIGVLGGSAVIWNDGDVLAIIMADVGSSVNSYRSITSYEGYVENSEFPSPSLEIVYGNNIYANSVLDTFIAYSSNTTTASSINYANKQIIVGERNDVSNYRYRGLIKGDFSEIPTSASVTSASLCLYHEAEKASNTRPMKTYRMLSDWDLYSTSWNRKNGLTVWGVGGSSVTDCETSWSGSISLASNESKGWKYIPLSSGSVEDWITGALPNYGLMLKMDTETNDAHYFTSSEGSNLLNRPKFVISYTYGGSSYIRTIQT